MNHARVVVVPTDFSRLSLQALEPALQMIDRGAGTLHVLHVIDDVEMLATSVDGAVSARLTDELVTEARAHFARLVPRLADCPHHFAIRMGNPAQGILKYAEEAGAEMIVMATHGREGLARAFLGSTTENVVRHAACPVLSVRPDDDATVPAETAASGRD